MTGEFRAQDSGGTGDRAAGGDLDQVDDVGEEIGDGLTVETLVERLGHGAEVEARVIRVGEIDIGGGSLALELPLVGQGPGPQGGDLERGVRLFRDALFGGLADHFRDGVETDSERERPGLTLRVDLDLVVEIVVGIEAHPARSDAASDVVVARHRGVREARVLAQVNAEDRVEGAAGGGNDRESVLGRGPAPPHRPSEGAGRDGLAPSSAGLPGGVDVGADEVEHRQAGQLGGVAEPVVGRCGGAHTARSRKAGTRCLRYEPRRLEEHRRAEAKRGMQDPIVIAVGVPPPVAGTLRVSMSRCFNLPFPGIWNRGSSGGEGADLGAGLHGGWEAGQATSPRRRLQCVSGSPPPGTESPRTSRLARRWWMSKASHNHLPHHSRLATPPLIQLAHTYRPGPR